MVRGKFPRVRVKGMRKVGGDCVHILLANESIQSNIFYLICQFLIFKKKEKVAEISFLARDFYVSILKLVKRKAFEIDN